MRATAGLSSSAGLSKLDRNAKRHLGRVHPGLKREAGHIVLCGDNSHIEFRRLRVKDRPGRGQPIL